MFKRKRQRTIALGKKTMDALNRLRFLLENEELAHGLGEPAEVDIHLDLEIDGLMRVSFLTDKDFREAESQGLSRPADMQKKVATVDLYCGGSSFTLYGADGSLICSRKVERFKEEPRYMLF